MPGIETKGKTDRQGPRRVAYAKKQIVAAGELATRLSRGGQIPFMIAADWNVDARKDARVRTAGFPYVTLQTYGLYSNWRVLGYPSDGTHGNRLIDGIFSTTRTVAPVRQQILSHYGSDHRAALVQFTNRARSASATLSTDTAAQVGSVPATITVPSSRTGSTMVVQGEQVRNAAAIIAEGKRAGIPAFGWVVAIATALQESGLRNLDHGDRDSQGLFQQRPSSGWGTVQQIRDPELAARAFYGVASHTSNKGLVDVPGWQSMSVAAAAQAVQISAFPSAYAKWEAAARAIVQQLGDGQTLTTTPLLCGTGQDPQLGDCPPTGSPAEKGLTRDALLVLRCVKAKFPSLTDFGGKHPDPLPDHPSGRAVDIMIPSYTTAEGQAFGWQIARWLQDNRQALGVQYLIYDAKIWSVERDAEGWRPYSPGYTGSINDSSLHRNHVHVTVYGDAGTGFQSDDGNGTVAAGKWTMALPKGSYTVGCAFACYVSASGLPHTGQDFPTPIGTTVRSTNAGTVEVSRDLNGSYGRYIVIRDADQPQDRRLLRPSLRARGARRPAGHRRTGDRPQRQHRQQQRPSPALRDPDRRQPRQPDAGAGQDGGHAVNSKTFTWVLGAVAAALAVALAVVLLHRPQSQHRHRRRAGQLGTDHFRRAETEHAEPASQPTAKPASCRRVKSTPTTQAPALLPTARPTRPATSGSPSHPVSAAPSPRRRARLRESGGPAFLRTSPTRSATNSPPSTCATSRKGRSSTSSQRSTATTRSPSSSTTTPTSPWSRT